MDVPPRGRRESNEFQIDTNTFVGRGISLRRGERPATFVFIRVNSWLTQTKTPRLIFLGGAS